MQYCLLQGERLSHAVGCAFAACLERKQKREKECGVTATFDASRTTFTREGSFRVTTATEQAEREEVMRQMPDAKGKGCSVHSRPWWAEPALGLKWSPSRDCSLTSIQNSLSWTLLCTNHISTHLSLCRTKNAPGFTYRVIFPYKKVQGALCAKAAGQSCSYSAVSACLMAENIMGTVLKQKALLETHY